MLEAEDAGSPEPCTCLSLKPREGQRPGPFWEREPQRVGGGPTHQEFHPNYALLRGGQEKLCLKCHLGNPDTLSLPEYKRQPS